MFYTDYNYPKFSKRIVITRSIVSHRLYWLVRFYKRYLAEQLGELKFWTLPRCCWELSWNIITLLLIANVSVTWLNGSLALSRCSSKPYKTEIDIISYEELYPSTFRIKTDSCNRMPVCVWSDDIAYPIVYNCLSGLWYMHNILKIRANWRWTTLSRTCRFLLNLSPTL